MTEFPGGDSTRVGRARPQKKKEEEEEEEERKIKGSRHKVVQAARRIPLGSGRRKFLEFFRRARPLGLPGPTHGATKVK